MSDRIVYSVNRSSESDIAVHLLVADTAFEPFLSGRLDIRAYAQKLHSRADRFEAWLGVELIGLVASYCNQPDLCRSFVSNVSVWTEYQGAGIAGRLMRQCIEHVRGIGFAQIELEVDQSSHRAIVLYQKLGFNTLSSSGSTLKMELILGNEVL